MLKIIIMNILTSYFWIEIQRLFLILWIFGLFAIFDLDLMVNLSLFNNSDHAKMKHVPLRETEQKHRTQPKCICPQNHKDAIKLNGKLF